MGSATKNTRREASRSDDDDFESEGDDGSDSFPKKMSKRQESDYKLSLQRAHADQKFQSTMAHIIEKYSHNFDGIGDEIDLETGEIVVNNGHVRNMRDERDIGESWETEEDGQDDGDDGILLEDLMDSDIEDREEEEPERITSSTEDAEEETSARQGNQGALELSVVGPISQISQDPRLASICQTSYDLFLPYSFAVPPPMFFGSPSPYPNIHPPYGYPALGMPHGFAPPVWDSSPHADIPVHRANSNKLVLAGKTVGYEFTSEDGEGSVWASNPRDCNSWTPRQKPRTGFKEKTGKTPKSSKRQKLSGAPPSQQVQEECIPSTISDRDGDDYLPPYAAKNITPQSKHDKYSNVQSSTGKRKRGKKEKEEEDVDLMRKRKTKTQPTDADESEIVLEEEDTLNQRRSGRARKPAEYMGKISWSQILEGRDRSPEYQGLVFDTSDTSDDFDHDDVQDDVSAKTSMASGFVECQQDNSGVAEKLKSTIPDSQDSAGPLSSAPDQERKDMVVVVLANKPSRDTACAFSDDEAPLIIRRKTAKKPAVKDVRGPEQMAGNQGTGAREPIVQPLSQVEDNTEKKKQKGGSSALKERAKNAANGAADVQKRQRKHGRPRKSNVSATVEQANSDQLKDAMTSSPARKSEIQEDAATIQRGIGALSIMPSETLHNLKRDRKRSKKQRETNPKFPEDVEGAQPGLDRHLRKRSKSTPTKVPTDLAGHSGEMVLESDKENGAPIRENENKTPELRDATSLVSKYQAELAENSYEYTTLIFYPLEAEIQSIESETLDSQTPPTPTKPLESRQPQTSTPTKKNPLPSRTEPLKAAGHSPVPTPQKQSPSPSLPGPSTPRHKKIRVTRAPSSRRSILSLLSDDDEDGDELGRDTPSIFSSQHGSSATKAVTTTTRRKIWRSSALTTEVYHTPVKKRTVDVFSPGSIIRTPGGTERMCGVGGYRCGRDFCFTCL